VKISNIYFLFFSSLNQYFPHIPYVASWQVKQAIIKPITTTPSPLMHISARSMEKELLFQKRKIDSHEKHIQKTSND
jgi:hypothetical protein